LSTAGFTAVVAAARQPALPRRSPASERPGGVIKRREIRFGSHRQFAMPLPGSRGRLRTTSPPQQRATQPRVRPTRGPAQRTFLLEGLFPRASWNQRSYRAPGVQVRPGRRFRTGTPLSTLELTCVNGASPLAIPGRCRLPFLHCTKTLHPCYLRPLGGSDAPARRLPRSTQSRNPEALLEPACVDRCLPVPLYHQCRGAVIPAGV